MHVRVCRECDEEFQPTVESCSDCGGGLVDRFLDPEGAYIPDAAESAEAERGAARLHPGADLRVIAHGALREEVARMSRRLARSGIPFAVRAAGAAFDLLVDGADHDRARERLASLLPAAVASSGDGCPACGQALPAEIAECPGCGLAVGPVDSLECAQCGHERSPDRTSCPGCGLVGG